MADSIVVDTNSPIVSLELYVVNRTITLDGGWNFAVLFSFFLSLFHVFFTTLFFIGLRRPHPRCLKLDQPQWPYAQRNHNAPYRHIVFGPYDRPFGAPKTRPGAR